MQRSPSLWEPTGSERERGYATACMGKWHLGHHPEFYPTRHGFDSYYGPPLGHCFLPSEQTRAAHDHDTFSTGVWLRSWTCCLPLPALPVPKRRATALIDGHDISALMHAEPGAVSPYEAFFYHVRHGQLAGVRVASWKLISDATRGPWKHDGDALYDLDHDPGETHDLAAAHPTVVRELRRRLGVFRRELAANQRPAGETRASER